MVCYSPRCAAAEDPKPALTFGLLVPGAEQDPELANDFPRRVIAVRFQVLHERVLAAPDQHTVATVGRRVPSSPLLAEVAETLKKPCQSAGAPLRMLGARAPVSNGRKAIHGALCA